MTIKISANLHAGHLMVPENADYYNKIYRKFQKTTNRYIVDYANQFDEAEKIMGTLLDFVNMSEALHCRLIGLLIVGTHYHNEIGERNGEITSAAAATREMVESCKTDVCANIDRIVAQLIEKNELPEIRVNKTNQQLVEEILKTIKSTGDE